MKKELAELQSPQIPVLETKHLEWLFKAAQEHFAERIEKLELENVRHHHHIDNLGSTHYCGNGIAPNAIRSRSDRVISNAGYIKQYEQIVVFCAKARELVMEKSAKEFAEQVVPQMVKRAKGEV